AKRAEEIYSGLDDKNKKLSRQIFLRLVTIGEGTEDTRRRTLRSELLGIQAESDAIEELLDSFAAYRLLSLDNGTSRRKPIVEIAHEVLIREWERLKAWLNESRDEIRTHRRLTFAAAEWQASGEDPSFLANGTRLEAFADWAEATALNLNKEE